MIWKFMILSDPGFAVTVTVLFILVFIILTIMNYKQYVRKTGQGGNCEAEKEKLLKELEQLRVEQANQKPKQVMVEITDPLLVAEIKTQYELQDVYNAQIDQLDTRIAELDTKIAKKDKELKNLRKELSMQLSKCRSKDQVDICYKMFKNDMQSIKQSKNKMVNEQLRLQEQRLGKVIKSESITRKVQKIGIEQYKKNTKKQK